MKIKTGFIYSAVILAAAGSLFVFLSLSGSREKHPAHKGLPNVIVITLSGVRNSESIGDPTHQYIPNLWGKMLKEGTLYTNLESLGAEFHMPPVDAVNTGKVYPVYVPIDSPSIFQYLRKKYSLPMTKVWLVKHFLDKDGYYKTEGFGEDTIPCELSLKFVMSNQLREELTAQESDFVVSFRQLENNFKNFELDHWDTVDEIFCQFFRKIIDEHKPKFIHYVMAGIETAHYDTFGRYVISLKHCDNNIFGIWKMTQEDPDYKDNTYLFVCPDHARNVYYMQHTENVYDNPSKVWLYVYGPSVKKGAVINRRINHTDIFATLADIFKIDVKKDKGRALKDCLRRGADF